MKDLIKKVFSKNISSTIFVGFGLFAVFTWIVFPGLTESNTLINIVSAIIGLFSLVFLFYYLGYDKLLAEPEEVKPGETELDYINPEELKKPVKKAAKKKAAPKVKKIHLKTDK